MADNIDVDFSAAEIMVVDDNPSNLKALSYILATAGYQVRQANCGEIALASVAAKLPDIILLDIMMPGIDGIEVCARLKADGATSEIPVIFISAVVDVDDKVRCFDVGGVDFISKPFQIKEVLVRVRTHLQLRKLQLQAEENLRKEFEENNRALAESFDHAIKSQANFIQQERLAAIGQLAAGVAHEINNPLGFVSSNVEVLGNYLKKLQEVFVAHDQFFTMIETVSQYNEQLSALRSQEKATKVTRIMDDLPSLITETTEGIKRIQNIVNGLRRFSRIDIDEDYNPYNINEGLQTTLIVARNEIKYYANVVEEYAEEMPLIEAKGGEINQVLLNLIVNASHAIQAKNSDSPGIIGIKTWSENDRVFCRVSDDGIGMDGEVVRHIYEPFYTTKAIGQGTGLGLSISYEIIVHHHQGAITAESKEGAGTNFIISLPVCQKCPVNENEAIVL